MTFNIAKIMSKGQITLPVKIRHQPGLSTGDRVALIYEDKRVRSKRRLTRSIIV